MESTSSTQPSLMENDNVGRQVYVITPNQLAKLGFSTQIHSIIATHVQPEQTLKVESVLDDCEEQSLSISSSSTSNSEEDESNTCITERNYSKISNQTRKPVNVEIIKKEHTPSHLQNEMKSKLYHLLNTNANESLAPSPSAARNINTSAIKDSPKMHILNYATSPLSINCPQFNTIQSRMADRRNACVISASADTTAARQNMSGLTDNIEKRHKLLIKQMSHDSVKPQQIIPRIINSKSVTEATKSTPLKLEIVSNEIVNFSPMEIQNILNHNTPSHSKVTESIPQSTSNTIINKTAYLQNPSCTHGTAASKVEKHFKKKLYETFHVADNASVEKRSNDTCDRIINLNSAPEASSCQKIIENTDTISRPMLQSFKVENVQYKTDLESLSKNTSKQEINEFSERNKFADRIFVNKQEVETASFINDSQIEQDKKLEKLPAPRVLNLELQGKKGIITNQSYLDSTAINLGNQKKEKLRNPEEEKQRETREPVQVAQSSKLHEELLKKVNALAAQSHSTKPSHAIKRTRYELIQASKNVNVKEGKFRCYGKIKKDNTITSDSSLGPNTDSDKSTSDVDAPAVKLKYFKHVKKEITSAVTEETPENSTDSNLQQSFAGGNLQHSLTERNLQSSLADSILRQDLIDANLQQSLTERNLQSSLADNILRQDLTDANLQQSLADSNVQQSLIDSNLQHLADVNLQQSLTDFNLQQSFADNNAQQSLTDGNLQQSLTDSNLQQSLTDDKLQQSLTDDNLQQSFADGNAQQSLTDDNLQQSLTDSNLQQSLTDDKLQQSLTDDNLQQSFADGNAQQSLTDDNLQQSFADGNLQQSLADSNLQQSLTDSDPQQSLAGSNLQQTLADNNLQQTLADSNLQQGLKDSNLQQISTGNNLQQSLTDDKLQQSLTDNNLQQSFADGNAQQSLTDTNLQQTLADSNLQQTLADNNLQQTLADSNRQQTLADSNLQQTLADSNLQQTLADSNLQQTLVDSNLQQTLADSNLQQTLADSNLQQTLAKSNHQQTLAESNRQQSLPYSYLQQSSSGNNLQQSLIDNNLHQSSDSDVFSSDIDEIIPKRKLSNTNIKQDDQLSTDINLYVQSKTSGRKRKYVDYKVLSGISTHGNSSDSESINDTPAKKCATEKSTETTSQDKSVVETKSLKKRGRGRPRRSEIKSSECDVQIKPDTSESEVLNLEVEEQCDSSILPDNNTTVQLEEKELKRKSSTESATPVKRPRGRPRKIVTVRTDSETEKNLDSSVQDTWNSPKSRGTSLVGTSTTRSKIPEKRLRSYTKFLSKKMISPEKDSDSKNINSEKKSLNADKNTLQKEKETELDINSMDSNSAKSPHVKSVNTPENGSKSVEKKRRGRPKAIAVEAEQSENEKKYSNSKKDMTSSRGVDKPDVEIKQEKKGRGRPRKIKLNENEPKDNKTEADLRLNKDVSEKVLPASPMDISENESKTIVRRGRRRSKKNTGDSIQKNETELEQISKSLEDNKPRITEVNLSEDRANADIDLNNTNLNNSTDPLEIEGTSEPIDDNEEARRNVNKSHSIKNSNDSLENKRNTPEKRRRGRPKTVVNNPSPISEADMEKTSQITSTQKVEIESKNVNVEQKRRGRKRKIVATNLEESDSVTCAVCKSVLKESQWNFHSELKHNNLTWKTNDTPLDLSNQALVDRILSDLYNSKKVLHCELCECEIETLSGYTEHKEICAQKSEIGEPAPKKKLMSSVIDTLFSSISTPTKKEESPAVITRESISKEDAKSDTVADSGFVEEILPPLGANDIRCAVCKDVMPKGQWSTHKQKKHNNLAWKVGDKPLDLNDRSLVMRILKDLSKSKKPLSCEFCGVGKKSVLGYLSHKSQCQKSESEIDAMKIKCELCGRTMLPVSLQRHMALSHSVNVPETDLSSLVPTVSESIPQGKRKAANKAAGLIHSFAKDMLSEASSAKFKKYVKNVNFRSVEAAIYKFSEDIQKHSYTECVFDECNYRSSEHEDLFYHIENCDKNSNTNYTCNFCLATFKARRSVRDHIKLSHNNNENRALISQFSSDNEFNSESEDESDDCESDSKSTNAGCDNAQFLDVDVLGVQRPRKMQTANSGKSTSQRIHFLQQKSKKPQSIYLNAYWWMEKFCQENYKLQNIFPRICYQKEDWVQLEPMQIVNYLPKLRCSIDTARLKINNVINPICYEYAWKKYKLFESEIFSDDGGSIFFCGGPINALAWVPTPHTETNCDQILAVSVAPDPDEKYNTNTVHKSAGLIQFWNTGMLHNKTISTYQPKLEFTIAHNYGIIWAMEWCPSGCYDLSKVDDVRKLGLLAIACSDSFVYIYLVPFPGQLSGTMFKTKPAFKLQLEDLMDLTVGEIDYYSTRLSWCKTDGHQFLAVGYSNGTVAIYDLKTEASLLKTEIDGIITLQPIQKFQAHLDAVTALCLYHLHGGKRWLLTGSLDRDCKLWDLENISEPINYCKKFVITDAVWLVHWLCSVYSYDHGCITGAVPTSLNPARDFFASCTSFMPSNSRVTSISANEWANLFIQANDCGEVICGFPDQLLKGYDCDKKKSIRKSRCLASYSGIVPKSIPSSERMKLERTKLETLKSTHPNLCADKNLKKHSANTDRSDESSEPRKYFEAEEKYGLVFCDLNMNFKLKEPTAELDKLLQSTHYFSLAKPDMYPLQSITKVSLNPNKNSFLFYAYGYQVGIVRVSNVRFLCPENEQSILLH